MEAESGGSLEKRREVRGCGGWLGTQATDGRQCQLNGNAFSIATVEMSFTPRYLPSPASEKK